MIQVKNNGVTISPILQTDYKGNSGIATSLDTTKCGSNTYFYTNYTVNFVVTEDPACLLTISLSETLQLTTHFSMDINTFFSNPGYLTDFITNLAALLNVTDTSRIKVVGVLSGSTTIATILLPATGSSPASDPSVAAAAASFSAAVSSGAAYTAFPATFGTVTSISSLYVAPAGSSSTPSSTTSSSLNIGLIVGVSIAGFVLLVGIFITMIYCIRKRAKVVEEIRSS
jgi:hypothetical protein